MGWQILHLATSLVQAAALQGAPAIPVTASPASLVWGDIDGDGFHDALVLEASGLARLLHNEGNGQLADITIWSGLEGIATASLALWQDYDRDGRLDLFVGTSEGMGKLFRNLGEGRFENVARQAGIGHVSADLAAAWIDYDQDGFVDLHVRTAQGDLLYRNLTQGSFESVDLYAPTPTTAPIVVGPGASSLQTSTPSAEEAPAGSPLPESDRPSAGIPRTTLESVPAPGTTGREELTLGGPTPLGPIAAAPAFCAGSIDDAAGPGCISASSSPTLGSLYPLSTDLFVDSLGRVGIGTTTPFSGVRLEVAGRVRTDTQVEIWNSNTAFYLRNDGNNTILSNKADFLGNGADPGGQLQLNGSNGLSFRYGDAGSAGIEAMRMDATGNVGIGTTNPVDALHVDGTLLLSFGSLTGSNSAGMELGLVDVSSLNPGGTSTAGRINNLGLGHLVLDIEANDAGDSFAIRTDTNLNGTVDTIAMVVKPSGNVGIGTTTPGKKLDVNGDIRSDTIELTGADLVEGFETSDGLCTPGMVVVIDPDHPGQLMASQKAYDSRVAGIVSGAGGVEHGIFMGRGSSLDGSTPIAMTGRVYVDATTENGAIRPGDLLTTSSTAGHAMKATDSERGFGAVIGKAMTSLDADIGLVLVLVNLQ